MAKTRIGFLLFPELTQLDLTGPYEVLHRAPGAEVHTVWKDTAPVRADSGLRFVPSTRMSECPPLDIVVVPGGWGQVDLMEDAETLGFLRRTAQSARYVTSVCTGSLLLGVAGLLEGYDAATHWAFMDILPIFGARPVTQRVVIDRDRITAGGVTAGIDFGLRLLAELGGESLAKGVELGLEYDPAPPFGCGHPSRAEPAILAEVRARFAESSAARAEKVRRAIRG